MPTSTLNLDAIDLSDEKLKRLAGTSAFHRGYSYYKQDPQLVYKIKGTKVSANVSGTYAYQQQLTFALQGVDGHCSCPASENIDFCKHCVAVVLAVRESQATSTITKNPKVSAKLKELDTLQRFLGKLERSELEISLLKLISEDKAQFSQWALRAHNALNPVDAKFLKKKITQAFPINKHLHRYSQVGQYFAQAEPIIDLLLEQREGLSTDALFSLTDYALTRLDKALQTVDDSGGYRFHCQDSLSQLFIQGVEAKQFGLQELVAFLLTKFKENNEIAPDVPDAYQHLLGDEGLHAFYQALLLLWRNTPVPSATEKCSETWDENSHYHLFFYQLNNHARQTKNLDLLIELQQRNARTASDFANLLDFLIEANEWERAAITLKRAQKCKDSHYVANQLLNSEIKLLIQEEKYTQAYSLLGQAFSTKPSLYWYKKMHQFSEQYSYNPVPQSVNFEPQTILNQLKERQQEDPLNQFTFSRLILDILFYHQRYSEVLKIEAQDKLPKEYLSRLIDAYPASPDVTLPLYEKLVAAYVRFSDNEHYRQAISVLITAKRVCLTPESKSQFSLLLERITITYKAKRNFIKFLKEACL
ncbi:hypothetical protein A9R01_05020 ['Osedax' symbiont bacterium Rs2_46_30_T18]|nr:hypothetical protein A9R01_05020 ['Osedax' symbiont bacterium Rs2_46_30_T18]